VQVNPIDLLSLSACQTAEGDDRAPLGIAGAALQANAGSALGSLWPVDDSATKRLMVRFYELLTQEHESKSRALQRSQGELLADPAFAHPFYWAPFILVGDWR
jgi:CHAT domain-containing protein